MKSKQFVAMGASVVGLVLFMSIAIWAIEQPAYDPAELAKATRPSPGQAFEVRSPFIGAVDRESLRFAVEGVLSDPDSIDRMIDEGDAGRFRAGDRLTLIELAEESSTEMHAKFDTPHGHLWVQWFNIPLKCEPIADSDR